MGGGCLTLGQRKALEKRGHMSCAQRIGEKARESQEEDSMLRNSKLPGLPGVGQAGKTGRKPFSKARMTQRGVRS